MVDDSQVRRFQAVFECSTASRGRWDPKDGRTSTVRDAPEFRYFKSHLNGKFGTGVVPIRDDGLCTWGVIDIDVHGPNAYDADPAKVAPKADKLNVGLIVCRSKSGGAHCYAFFPRPLGVEFARQVLKGWATTMGYPTAEVFPKQDRIVAGGLGSWINLPYFNAAGVTERYAIIGGMPTSLEHFLTEAEKRAAAVDQGPAAGTTLYDLSQAPPCIVKIHDEHRGEGHRNLSLFQASIWLKRIYPDDWKSRMELFNQAAFAKPLDDAEIRKIRGSVNRTDYAYKCKDEPCLSLCNKEACKLLKFGVRMGTDYQNMPPVEKLLKIATDPPTWVVTIYGQEIAMKTRTLISSLEFRERVLDLTRQLLPVYKADDWMIFVQSLLTDKLSIIGDTEGIALNEQFLSALSHILRDAQTQKQEQDENLRKLYVRDTGPATVTYEDKRMVMFRLLHLEQRLRAQYNIRMTSSEITTQLHLLSAISVRALLGKTYTNVWMMPYSPPEEEVAATFRPDY